MIPRYSPLPAMASKTRAQESKNRSLADDLIEALQDDRLVDAIGKALSPLITLTIQEAVKKQLEGLSSAVKDLKAENVRLTTQCQAIKHENTQLRKTTDEHARRLDELESYSRNDNLIFKGLPERTFSERATNAPSLADNAPVLRESYGMVEETVLEFMNVSLGVKVQPQDLAIAHRLKAGQNDKVRPVIVRFLNRKVRNEVYQAKKRLKNIAGNQVYISEHLTKSASDLFFAARKMVKDKRLTSSWTQNGQVYVKNSSDPTTRPKLIKCTADLNSAVQQ